MKRFALPHLSGRGTSGRVVSARTALHFVTSCYILLRVSPSRSRVDRPPVEERRHGVDQRAVGQERVKLGAGRAAGFLQRAAVLAKIAQVRLSDDGRLLEQRPLALEPAKLCPGLERELDLV